MLWVTHATYQRLMPERYADLGGEVDSLEL